MCNRYAAFMARGSVAAFFGAAQDLNNNQPPAADIYPDYAAPVVINGEAGGRIMKDMRWGMPSSKRALIDAATKRAGKIRAKGGEVDFAHMLRMEPDKGTTNVRNTASRHWQPWLGPKNRCLVPFTAFSEPDQVGGSLRPIWFALSDGQPLACFAGIWTPWTCVRKIKDGEVTCELYGFLTTDANAEVAIYHSKAMPVILTTAAERDMWLSDAPWDEVRHLQRPLPSGALNVIASPPPQPTAT